MKLNGPPQYFDRTNAPRVVASCGCARMGGADDCPKETRDDYSSKNTGRDCGVGFGCACDDVAGEGPDRAGMQRQIPGRENRRHARRPEVERLPESPVRRRRYAAAAAAPAAAPAAAAPAAAPKEPPRRSRQEGSQAAAELRRLLLRQAPRSIRTPSIRNIPRRPPARPACTPAWISTTPTRPPTAMAA